MSRRHDGGGARPARIALLCETDLVGGAESMLIHLARGLRDRGHTVHFVGPTGSGPLSARFAADGFETHTFTLRRAVDPVCVRELADLFTAHGIELAHSHMFTMAVYGTAAARRAGIAHVLTMHGTGRETSALRRRVALRWAIRRSQAAIAVSDALKDELRGLLGRVAERMVVVANGVPDRSGERATVRAELGIADDEVLVLAVGNLFRNKGHLELLQALATLPAGVRWRVAIAGRPEDGAPGLRAFIAEHGWDGRAHLLGTRADVPDLLAAADVYAMPSHREALPMALLEAMMSGTAIVASRVGGIPEALADRREGLLVPPGDVEGLAGALRRLLGDPKLRQTLGGAARERALRDFSVDAMVDAHERLYAVSMTGVTVSTPS